MIRDDQVIHYFAGRTRPDPIVRDFSASHRWALGMGVSAVLGLVVFLCGYVVWSALKTWALLGG